MTGTDVKDKVKGLRLSVPEFSKFCGIKRRTIFDHYFEYKDRELPEELEKKYTDGFNAVAKHFLGIEVKTEEFVKKISGPSYTLLAEMIEVITKEMTEMRLELSEAKASITKLEEEVKKLKTGKLQKV